MHGLFVEGARWDKQANCLGPRRSPTPSPQPRSPTRRSTLPVMFVKGVTRAEIVTEGVYQCPVYTTTIRGPTFTFRAPLRTDRPDWVWILAAVCLLCQPDQ